MDRKRTTVSIPTTDYLALLIDKYNINTTTTLWGDVIEDLLTIARTNYYKSEVLKNYDSPIKKIVRLNSRLIDELALKDIVLLLHRSVCEFMATLLLYDLITSDYEVVSYNRNRITLTAYGYIEIK